jgi:hypothetical protein
VKEVRLICVVRLKALVGRAKEGGTSRRLALVFLILPVLIAPTSVGRAAPPINGVLFAVPFEGHSGDLIYLSGGYLPPYTEYYVYMACPNWKDAYKDNNYEFVVKRDSEGKLRPVPVWTDGNGAFVAFAMHAVVLNGVNTSDCLIYVSNTINPYGPELPAPYTILPPTQPPGVCSRTMCPHFTVAPKRVRAGNSESISVSGGYPGANGTVTVTFKGVATPTGRLAVTGKLHLDWRGSGRVRIKVPLEAAHLPCSQVTIQADLSIRGRFHYKRPSGPCFSVAA